VPLRVNQVEGRRGIARFVNALWQVRELNAGAIEEKSWVPPLRVTVTDILSQKNPFYQHANRALFVAERGGLTVGRIAAIENAAHNRYHRDRVGFFGFLETVNDPEVAHSLLDTAEGWLRSRSLNRSRGPISPSMNHECGLLIEGSETPPAIMTPWNPIYYKKLVESSGYKGIQDLLGYDITSGANLAVPHRIQRLAERTARTTGVTFRNLNIGFLEHEARKVLDLYCQAWSGNWGFTPPSWNEFWHIAKDLKSVLLRDFSFVAEVRDEVVGFMMVVRDINRILTHVPSGRLWPTTLFRLTRDLPKVQRGRIVLMGLSSEYRHKGLFPLFAYESARRAKDIGFEGAEASWVLNDNIALTKPMAAMGMNPYKRWRLYEKAI
tara:strand:+ start:3547 stop:4686 length:1140 start_codon:yes stop_codon:yes gene_type:complete